MTKSFPHDMDVFVCVKIALSFESNEARSFRIWQRCPIILSVRYPFCGTLLLNIATAQNRLIRHG